MEENKVNITRSELYNLVWSTPLLTLAKKYNISDNGLRKICKRMDIPLPKAGHWVKLKFGKRVLIKPLPEKCDGVKEVSFGSKDETDKTSPINQRAALVNEIKTSLGDIINVPDKIKKPGKLIVAARQQLSANEYYQNYAYNRVIACRGDTLDLIVRKQNSKRSLLFMDTLIKSLQARGHEIYFRNNFTYLRVKNQEYEISLREKMKRVVIPGKYYNSSEFHPTDILCFRTKHFGLKEYKDGKQLLEYKIAEIIANLEIQSDERNLEDEHREKWHKEREEKERLAQEFKERKKKELIDFKTLLENAERWHKADNLRKYIDEIEGRTISSNSITEDLKVWLEWARQKANWYDPFKADNDELLSDVNIETLSFKNI